MADQMTQTRSTTDSARLQEDTPPYQAAMERAVIKYRPIIGRIMDEPMRGVFGSYMETHDEVHGIFDTLRRTTDLTHQDREETVEGDKRRAWLRALHVVIAERGQNDEVREEMLMMEFVEKSAALVTKREEFRREALSEALDEKFKPAPKKKRWLF